MVPRLFVALRLGVGIALVVAVTAEIAANPHGMGYAHDDRAAEPRPGADAGRGCSGSAASAMAINVAALLAFERRVGAAHGRRRP